MAAASLVLLALAFFGGWRLARRSTPTQAVVAPVHSIVPLPPGTRLSGWASPVLALSHDGRKLAFVAEKDVGPQQLYVYHLDRGETQLVPGSETAEGPVFSPDGQWILFAVDVSPVTVISTKIGAVGQLKKFSLSTGLTQAICEIPDYTGASWADDGSIFFVGEQPVPLWKVSPEGGRPVLVAEKVRMGKKEGPRDLAWPQILPGGLSALVIDGDASLWGHAAVLSLDNRELSDLGVETCFARYAPTGHLLLLHPDGTLMAAPFDPTNRRVTGAPVAVLKDVSVSGNVAGAFAMSDNGLLVYASGYLRGSGREMKRLVRIGSRGELEPLPFEPDTFGRMARQSPDGRKLAVDTWDGSLWVYDLARASRTRLPTGKTSQMDYAIWAPDGERVLFMAVREGEVGYGIFRQKADGTEGPEALTGGGVERHPLCVSPDGRTLLYVSFGGPDERGLWILPLAPKSSARRVLAEPVMEAALSPDGRWLAYDVKESGGAEVYVQRFPELGQKIQVSSGGGQSPRWSRDGREIVYRVGDRFFAVRIAGGQDLNVAAPELIFQNPNVQGYDVSTDRKGFVAVFRPADSGIIRELHLVTGWFDDLTRMAGGRK